MFSAARQHDTTCFKHVALPTPSARTPPSTNKKSAIYGNFSAPKAQELVVARGGRVLELLRPNESGKLVTVASTDVFGAIRALAAFRLTGAPRDCVVVGSDSGRVVILEFNKQRGQFVKLHQETYGRSGCRRIVPGQYVAADPKGRAIMVAAVEKQKFVYVLNRDAAAALTISSPLEAHKSHNVVFSVAALDMGFDNPVFATIELDYRLVFLFFCVCLSRLCVPPPYKNTHTLHPQPTTNKTQTNKKTKKQTTLATRTRTRAARRRRRRKRRSSTTSSTWD